MKDNESMECFKEKYGNKQGITNVSEDNSGITKTNNKIAKNLTNSKLNNGMSSAKKIALGVLASATLIGGIVGAYFVGKKANTLISPTFPITTWIVSIIDKPTIIRPTEAPTEKPTERTAEALTEEPAKHIQYQDNPSNGSGDTKEPEFNF